MSNVLLAEPSFIPLNTTGIGVLKIGLLVLGMIAISAVAIAILLLLIHFANKLMPQTPPHQRVDGPPVTPVIRKCPKCGAELKSDVPEGLCPGCLLQRGIATEGGVPPGTPAFTPPPLIELAKLFPQLEILEIIGQGGMGAVYKARQPALDRFVALKILAPRSGGDLDFAGRFSREARALAKLSHPNIVAVYDFGQIASSPQSSTRDPRPLSYFLMEFVDGPNLRQVEQAGKLTPREALEIIPQICAALQFAHDEGIIHRDIKPENVLLDKKGRVKIADFGLAKILGHEADFRLTGARDVMGTPHYMAPEQVEKPQEVDHRADIYSLGVVFYEMLTGELPLGKFDPPSHKVQIDVRLDDVVLRSLANNPDRRYQQVSEVKTQVETIATTRMPEERSKVAGTPLFPVSFGLVFNSRLALNVARAGWILGCLAALGFLGSIPNLAVLKFMFSFAGFFGLIGLAVLMETIYRIRSGIPIGNFGAMPLTGKHAQWLIPAVLAVVIGALVLIALPLWKKGRIASNSELPHTAGTTSQDASTPSTPAAPLASAETWNPSSTAGEKPDLRKVLENASDMTKRGQYEKALGRYIWFHNHEREYGDSYQDVVRITSGITDWMELARRYPKAKQALLEIRADAVRKIAEGNGYIDLFQDIQAIDREFQQEDETYALYQAIRKSDPQLAHQCYFWMESLLVFKGEYQLCFENMGDPQFRFDSAKRGFDMEIGSQKRMAEIQERSRKQLEEWQKPSGAPIPTPLLNTSEALFESTTNRFVGVTGMLIEILAGTGHLTEATKIRDEAVAFMGDPRLKSAITDAQTRIQKRKSAALELPSTVRQSNSQYSNLVFHSPAQWQSTTNIPNASRETWKPNLAPGEKPDLTKIQQEAKELTQRGQYEEALGRYIWFYDHEPEFSEPYQDVVRISSGISDWVELGRRYPKAKQALLEIRDRNTRKISSGEGYFDLFRETASINDQLGNLQGTCALFKQLAASPDKKLAQQCYPIAEGALISRGEYELCLNFIGDPLNKFKTIQSQWQRSKASEQQQEDLRRQMEERMRAAQKPSKSNGIASASLALRTVPSPPKLADHTFVAQVRQLIEMLVGTHRVADAQKIRDEAILLLDDPGLKSAVENAGKTERTDVRPSSGRLMVPPPAMLPPMMVPPPPGNVIRPTRSLPARQPDSSQLGTSSALTPEEQVALIEIERMRMLRGGNTGLIQVLPPTPLHPTTTP
jgi:predicted Ser/Thr protein kinase